MECGKLTAKLRDAVPVCFIEDGKEVKRFKNIEIPDEISKLPYGQAVVAIALTQSIIIPSKEAANLVCMVGSQINTRFTTEAISPKILFHYSFYSSKE